jgi:hypothetical protein
MLASLRDTAMNDQLKPIGMEEGKPTIWAFACARLSQG